MPFDLGDNVRLTAECRDADGTLVNAGTAALTLTLPDGTTASPEVAVPSTAGQYVLDYVPAQAGRHLARWLFTTPASAYTDVFDVRPAAPPLIVSLADAKAHLNITSTREDEEIRGWLESVTHLVEQYTGISVRQSFTETHRLSRLGARSFVLRHTPVLEVTAVTGAILTDLDEDPDTGVVYHANGGLFSGSVTVAYTAGRDVIPSNITRAALIILQHLWRTQNANTRGPIRGAGDDYAVSEPIPGLGYAVPNRALQLLEPHRLPPGVA